MAKRKSALAVVAAGIGGAAAAGYGLSMGRDLWKSTKRHQIFLVAFFFVSGAIALPMIGCRELVKGHDRGPIGSICLTFIGSVILVVVGFALAVICFGFLTQNNDPDASIGAAIFFGTCSTAFFALIGLFLGASQRPGRVRAITTARANERFLSDAGFRETGGQDITHYDQSGQALRFLEADADRIIFMAVGRRGKRAYIDLAADGKMVAYSGVV